MTRDPFKLYDKIVPSRLMLGTSAYPSPAILKQAIKNSGCAIVTASLRREMARGADGNRFLEILKDLKIHILPNTAGCHSAKEAITTAQMARELFNTNWLKLEVIANDDTLQPNVFELVKAAKELMAQGFEVFPYTTEDLSVADQLLQAGCKVLMPWGAPIGSGQGLSNPKGLERMRRYYKDIPLIIDAGIGAPSHAAAAMEMGYDGILLNTAVAKAHKPAAMAEAFGTAIAAGRTAFLAGVIPQKDMASPSTPTAGTPFFNLDDKKPAKPKKTGS